MRWRFGLVTALLLVAAPLARAVVVRPSASGAQPAAPSPDPGVDHLAIIAGLSGVYLGDGWILTAGHVVTAARNQKKTDAEIGGRAFPLSLDGVVPLGNGGDRADLALVPVGGDPGLPPLEIAARTPAVGARLVLAGNGPLQETHRRCWDATGIERPPGPSAAICGFKWWKTPEGRTNGVQWGTSQVSEVGAVMPGPHGTRTRVFATTFRDTDATPFEAQAGLGDSGGPVFVVDGERPVLAGVMLGVASRSSVASLFGDRTYVADLSAYGDAIRERTSPKRGGKRPAKAKGPR